MRIFRKLRERRNNAAKEAQKERAKEPAPLRSSLDPLSSVSLVDDSSSIGNYMRDRSQHTRKDKSGHKVPQAHTTGKPASKNTKRKTEKKPTEQKAKPKSKSNTRTSPTRNKVPAENEKKPKPKAQAKPHTKTQIKAQTKTQMKKTDSSSRAPQPDSSSGIRFEELYRLKSVLGQGAFSTVREAKHKNDPFQTYAVKCVERAKLSREDEEALVDEVGILREFDHKAIICLYDFFEDDKMYFLVMEQMLGGELFDRIVAKSYYNEKEARDVCKILLEAVGYCHDNSVAHRDLKPENLLLVSQTDDYKVKIADFGFAKRVLRPNSLVTQCGTPGYVAPEILEGRRYDTKADMWSVGVILYILLGGYPPFIENNQRMLFRKIRKGQYEFHEEYWGSITQDAKTLIASLLNIDPVARLSANKALHNRWITSDAKTLEGKDLGTNLEEFRRTNAKIKFKAAVKSVIAVNKLHSLGMDFQKHLD